MAEFDVVMKQRERMHEQYRKFDDFKCKSCPIDGNNNGKYIGCTSFIIEYPQEAQEIIMNWAKEHPIKTNADKFKEVFGFEPYTNLCILENGTNCMECKDKGTSSKNGICCSKWWEEEYKEPKEVVE